MTATEPPRPERPTWFGTVAASDASPPCPPVRRRVGDSAPQALDRLWTAFMSARMLVALGILALHMAIHELARPLPAWLLLTCTAYVVLTTGMRLFSRRRDFGQAFGAPWLLTVGADLVFFFTLQLHQATGLNYTPLLALPVLMAAVMGSRPIALGSAALVTLLLLTHAVWVAQGETQATTSEIAQAGLTGAGLLVLALVTQQLSARLAGETSLARRSRLQAQIQLLVNNMVIEGLPDGVLVVDRDLVALTANPAAHTMLGATMDVTPSTFSLEADPAWAPLARIARATFDSGPLASSEVTLHHGDLHSSHLQVRTECTPSLGEDGQSLCVMFLQDLRELEARLRTEKLAAMGRMSAAVAHEIRNPLTAISQANALLEEDLTSPVHQRLTTMVRENAQRLGHIVDDVLNVVRVQELGDAAGPQSLALDEQTAAICQDWARQHAIGTRLALRLRATDMNVQFAREHLRRVLVNLLDNAARHATPRQDSIQVSTHSIRHGPVVLRVWSDGAPMEPTVVRHLFEPFFSSQSRSSGLGLFICRELCGRHGATIGHERSPREQAGHVIEGNEFFVTFRRTPGGVSTLD